MVSAGGMYDAGLSLVTLRSPQAPILKLQGCSLPATYSTDRREVTLILPPASDLPLAGGTWRFIVVFDPEFKMPWDDIEFAPRLLRPVVGTWLELDRQAEAKLSGTDTTSVSSRKAAPAPSFTATRTPATSATAMYVYDPAHWVVVLPARRFAELIKGADTRLPAKAAKLQVSLYTPPGQTPVKLASPTIAVNPKPQVHLDGPQFSTEPWVILTVLEIWKQLCQLQGPRGLHLCANPAFVRFLEQLAERDEAFREYLDSLYYRAPNGQLYKLTDLSEELAQNLPTVSIGGRPPLIFLLVLPRHIMRWMRRAALAQELTQILKGLRPMQDGGIVITAYVRNNMGGRDDDSARVSYKVLFDFVPRTQPQPLAIQGSIAP